MAPGGYMSTYRAYKDGTNKLVSWLVEAAQRCGIEGIDSATTRLAKAVVQCKAPKIIISATIISLAHSVIALRKQQSKLLARLTGNARNHASDQSHRYFISVLEDVLAILQSSANTAQASDAATSTDQGPEESSISNMFAALTVEEPVVTDDSVLNGATKPKKSSKHHNTAKYQLESTPEEDMLVAMIAALNDINDIREFVQQLWMDYKAGKIDVMNAAVTTDTAFGTIRRICDELAEIIPGEGKYYTMVNKLAGGPTRTGSERTWSMDGDMADWLAVATERLLSEFGDVLAADNSVPIYKPGHLGFYYPDLDRAALTEAERHHEDRIILMEFLPEIGKIARLRNDLVLEDELTAALKTFIVALNVKKCPMHAIFNARMFLDIHHILREDAVEPFNELRDTGRRCVDAVDKYFAFTGNNRVDTWPEHNDEGLRQFRQQAKQMANTDVVGNIRLPGIGRIGPEFHFFKRHPVLCGLYVFRLNLDLQEIGLTLCGAWGSVMYPIHLYNACRQSHACENEWEDAEYMYSIHTQQRILVGDPPTKPDDYLKRFVLALGGSAANFASNRRRNLSEEIQRSRKGPRGLKTTSPVRDVFQKRYTAGAQAVLSTANMIAMLGTASKAIRPCKPSLDVKAFSQAVAAQPQLTPLQLLTCVREGMAAEEMHLLFDYLGLHQRGYTLLSNLRLHIHEDIVRFCGDQDYVETASQLPYIVGYLFEILCNNSRVSEQMSLPSHGSVALTKAGEVLQDFLEDGAQGSEGKRRAFAQTRRAKWAATVQLEGDMSKDLWDPQKLAREENERARNQASASS